MSSIALINYNFSIYFTLFSVYLLQLTTEEDDENAFCFCYLKAQRQM